ncbi:putative AraC family transcriptional regulator [Gordonia otitidis NBRC 100426]|uniref:AraC family transcriptional regulator n=2 Tax=Gordonia otitidis TaxID=249058 RepID=H5TLH6_GORO1|nr:putative AraC family transcriptional regulator [Gordonia otitidis NBRC 100426]
MPAPEAYAGRTGLMRYSANAIPGAAGADVFEALVYRRALSSVHVRAELSTARRICRSEASVERSRSGLVAVVLNGVAGCSHIEQHGRVHTIGPGEAAIIHMDVPFTNWTTSVSDFTAVLIPEAEIGVSQRCGDQVLLGVPNGPLARGTAMFLRRFVVDAAVGLHPAPDADTERVVIDLIRATLSRQDLDSRRLIDSARSVKDSVRDLIEKRYSDPAFCADVLARELFMSRRHLYRHFDSEESTPARLIATRRLARARELLAEEVPAPLQQIALRSGYASASTLRSRFRAEYDLSPREYRESITAQRAAGMACSGPVNHGHPVEDDVYE